MLSIALLELLDASSRIHKLLFAGEKGMAGRADLNPHLFHDRTHFDFIAAGTYCINCMIFRMNSVFHSPYSSNTLEGAQILTKKRIFFSNTREVYYQNNDFFQQKMAHFAFRSHLMRS